MDSDAIFDIVRGSIASPILLINSFNTHHIRQIFLLHVISEMDYLRMESCSRTKSTELATSKGMG